MILLINAFTRREFLIGTKCNMQRCNCNICAADHQAYDLVKGQKQGEFPPEDVSICG